jgi:hypothetical protein
MASLSADGMTQGEAARATGLPRQLVSAACCYLRDGRFAAFDADLAMSAPSFHATFSNTPATSPQQRFAVMVQAWQAARHDERLSFTMALQRLNRARTA